MTWTMNKATRLLCLLAVSSLIAPALAQQGADPEPPTEDVGVSHVDCTFFGSARDKYVPMTAGEDLAAMTAREADQRYHGRTLVRATPGAQPHRPSASSLGRGRLDR